MREFFIFLKKMKGTTLVKYVTKLIIIMAETIYVWYLSNDIFILIPMIYIDFKINDKKTY